MLAPSIMMTLLKERSHVAADSETSSAPAVASGRERLLSAMIPQGKAPVSDEKGEMRCFELDCGSILIGGSDIVWGSCKVARS